MKTCIKSLIIILFVFLHSSLNAASITGTIFHSDTTTPITTNGLNILVEAYTTQCPSPENCTGWCAGGEQLGGWVDSDTGAFIIHNIPAGSYFLVAKASYGTNYLSEWWSTPESVRNCDEAQEVTVSESEEKSGINFYLDPGATISGTIFKNDGVTPIITPYSTIEVYSDSGESLYSTSTNNGNPNGDFAIIRIPTGQYYLKAVGSSSLSNNEIEYTSEWWTNTESSENFSDAQIIEITEGEEVSGKNFQLDPLFKILGTIFYEEGNEPVRQNEEKVEIFLSETPCGVPLQNYPGHNDWSGNYLIKDIPAGNYFLKAMPYGTTRFKETWWNSTGNIANCTSAQQIEVGGENNIFDKDFHILFLKPFPWYLLVPIFGHQ